MATRYEIQKIGHLKCFVSSLELKIDLLPTNFSVTLEFNLHSVLKVTPYTVSSGDILSYTEPLTAYQAHSNT